MLLTAFLRMIGFAAGAVLYAFLLVLAIRRRPARSAEWALLVAVAGAFSWYTAGAVAVFYLAGVGDQPEGELARVIQYASWVGLAVIPAATLQFAAGLNGRQRATLAYLAVPAAWWMLVIGPRYGYTLLLMAMLAAATAELLRGRPPIPDEIERRFRPAMAAALGIAFVGAAPGEGSAWGVLGGIAPAVCLSYFVSRFDFLGLRISRRIIFAAVLGGLSAVYLLIARRVSDWAQEEFEVFAPALEVMLILAAVGVWVPLYAWMNRVLSRRTHVYADFGKRLIQDAAAIFGLEQRMEYIARELGRSFKLRRVFLATTDEPKARIATFGPADATRGEVPVALMAQAVRSERQDIVTGPRAHRHLLTGTGFNYLFPLWYEDRLVGLLLVDTAPRVNLDEDEDILEGLSSQISHSMESCRLVERKISLEKALARSEHMAALGQMAATIAHEVKNPLSSIKALAQLMQEDAEVGDNHRRDLAYIVGETNRLNSCVEQLLTFSRPFPEDRSDVAVLNLLEDISRVLNREYAGRRIRIEHHAPADLTLRNVDPQSLRQIVLNLALNAVQASAPESTVELFAERSAEGAVAITVADQGTGIPAEIHERIFEPFFTTKQKGSGLGLAIVSKNVRHLGGDVRLKSPVNDGHGTAVTVTLPAEVS